MVWGGRKYISSGSKKMLLAEKVFRILFVLLPHHGFEEKTRNVLKISSS